MVDVCVVVIMIDGKDNCDGGDNGSDGGGKHAPDGCGPGA